jgi:hypothetical protein
MARWCLKKLICYFFGFFFDLHFAEGFSLPMVFLALGKGFAVCPIKGPRQRPLRRLKIFRGLFAFAEGFWPKNASPVVVPLHGTVAWMYRVAPSKRVSAACR